MMPTYKKIFSPLIFLFLSGCVSGLHVPDIDEQIAASPVVEMAMSESFTPRTATENIALFYRDWNAWTRPAAVKDWKHHYVMGDASSPQWPFIKVAHVTVYLRDLNDAQAVAQLRETAHSLGGDAIVNLYREPLIDKKTMPADIIGYRYKGLIVSKN